MRYLPLLALALTACTHDVDETAPKGEISDEAQAVFLEPTDVATERVYMGTNRVAVSEETSWHYGVFDLEKNARIGIELQTTDGSWDWVGFKLYKVTSTGGLQLLGVLEGEGYVGAILRTTTGGSFVVESVTEWLPSTLQLDVTCLRANGKCAPLSQPGENCGSRGQMVCDTGLFCAIEAGCGRADEGGTCTQVGQMMCPAVYGPVVCGCDGRNYGTACQARSAGVNVDYQGECPCDPTAFTVKMDGVADVTGSWINKIRLEDYGFEVSSRLSLADGSYVYEQVHTPLCIVDRDVEGTVLCRRPSLVFSSAGTWANQGFAVQLIPDANGSPDQLAQSFGVYSTCEGAIQLQTTEMNQERVLERDRCSDTVCGENEHCELQEVQCFAAPCFPVPSCVAN